MELCMKSGQRKINLPVNPVTLVTVVTVLSPALLPTGA